MGKASRERIEGVVGLVEQSQFDKALSSADEIIGSKKLGLYGAGRLSALRWYCQYMLDDDIEADSISRHVAEETRMEFLAGFGNQLSEIDALHLAEPVLERLTIVAPDDVRSWYSYGNVLLESEEWELAIEALERAKKLDASFAPNHYALGRCYRENDAPQDAAAAYQAFLTLEPDDIDALIFAGIAHSDAGQYDEAATMLEKAISVDPNCSSAYFNLAVVAFRAEDLGRLQVLQEQVSRIASDDWRLPATTAMVHELRGKYWDAWECQKAAFSIAVEAEDWKGLDAIIEAALFFALEHGFEDHIDPWIDGIFRYHCLSEGVLDHMRELTEPKLEQASCFWVTVEGRIPATDLSPCGGEHAGEDVSGYFRTVGVLAETEEKARDIAMGFDRRLDGQPVSIELVETAGDTRDVHQGVYWCQKSIYCFPLGEE